MLALKWSANVKRGIGGARKSTLQHCVGSTLLQRWQKKAWLAQVKVSLCMTQRDNKIQNIHCQQGRSKNWTPTVDTQLEGKDREKKKEKKEHRTILSAETEANYHSHCTRRHKLDWLALSGGVDSKTEQSVTKKTHCSVARRQEEANDMQIDWMFVLAGKSNQWHFCLLAPARGASTSDSSCAADRPGISTLESGRGETFSDLHLNYEAVSLIYHRQGRMNRIRGLVYRSLSVRGENKVANIWMISASVSASDIQIQAESRTSFQWSYYFPVLELCGFVSAACFEIHHLRPKREPSRATKKPRKNIVVSIIRMYLCPDLRWDTLLVPRYIAKKKKKGQTEKEMHCFLRIHSVKMY